MLSLRDIELLNELQHTENGFRLTLSKLLGSCSPLKCSSSSLTTATRRLVAHHQLLHQLLIAEDFNDGYASLVSWMERAVPVYANYIANYSHDVDTLPLELQLRKQPLQRLTELTKTAKKLEQVPGSTVLRMERLVESARDVVEKQNLNVDLQTVRFDDVHDLNEDMSATVAYFKLEDIDERDYFEFELQHPKADQHEQLVEVFKLKNGRMAICSVQPLGRNLLFPPLKISEYQMTQNDLDSVVLSREEVSLKLRCPDQRQMLHWNGLFAVLSQKEDASFLQHYSKLSPLKNGNIGLGLQADSETMGSSLRKSSPMLAKHNSLVRNSSHMSGKLTTVDHYFKASHKDLLSLNNYTDMKVNSSSKADTPLVQSIETPHLEKVDEFESYVAAISEAFSPVIDQVNSPVQSLNTHQLQNDSVVSLPTFKHSKGSIHLTKQFAQSVSDLSKPALKQSEKKERSKKRKSIFGLFSKKDDEPSFEIVTRPTTNTSSTPPSSASPSNPKSTNPTSMASLYRSVQNLNITTAASSTTSLPPPFIASVSESSKRKSSALEDQVLRCSTVSNALTNSVIVSKWTQNKWQSIGKHYQNEIRFLHNSENRTMVIYTDLSSDQPDLFIPLNNPHTTLTKSSALDLQIRCPQTLMSTHIHILTLRCCDSKVAAAIRDEFIRSQKPEEKETISSSSTLLFDKPSNSTSMSSVSLIDEFGPPNIYGLKAQSNSTLSFNSTETVNSGAELLLKSNVKVRLHKQDEDGDWTPVSMGKFSISSSVLNPQYSRFVLKCLSANDIETLVKNSLCSRLGKSGLKFVNIGEDGEEIDYLIEFRNEKECKDTFELLV